MKIKSLIVLLSMIFLNAGFILAQENSNSLLNDLVSKVGNVQADKITYQQTLKVLDYNKGKIELVVTKVEGEKKSSNYSFEVYLSDIDKNTIVSKSSGKIINVELAVQNNLKFIKEFAEGNLKEYSSKMQIVATDADNARVIIENLKKAIANIKPSELQFSTLKDATEWLSKNIGEVKTTTDQYSQTVISDPAKPYLITYNQTKTDGKGIATIMAYTLNLDDINKTAIAISVSGNLLKVKLTTKSNQNVIKVLKNNEAQNYDKDIELIFDDLDKARNTINALNAAIANTKIVPASFKTNNEALEKINGWLAKSNAGNYQYGQSFAFDGSNPDKLIITVNVNDAKNKTDENKFEQYAFDLDPNLVVVNTSGKDAQLILNVKDKAKYIKVFKNNVQQSYDDQVVVHAPDVESGRQAAEAFKFILKKSEYKPLTFKTISEAITVLKSGVTKIPTGTTEINQSAECASSEPYLLTLKSVKTDSKGVATEESFSFYPYVLDSKLAKISVSGKSISLTLKGKEKTKFIKVLKNGEPQNYADDVEIQFSDILLARNTLASITYIIAQSTPKVKTWSDKATASNFIVPAVKDVQVGKKQTKQKLELIGGDACKFNFTVVTINEKGESTEEIFEFNLLDINAKKCTIENEGTVLTLKLETKNQEKLIKYYKASKLQNYASAVEFLFEDYDLVRQVQESIIFMATECQK